MIVVHLGDGVPPNIKRVDITRRGPFGNPFIIGEDGNRDQVIEKFRCYAIHNPTLLERIYLLPDNTALACWCHPKPCHGDVIVELWETMHNVQ